jgi:hypothetical protein
MLGTSEDVIKLIHRRENRFISGAKTQQIVLYFCAASNNEGNLKVMLAH